MTGASWSKDHPNLYTPLHLASLNGHTEIVKFLLEKHKILEVSIDPLDWAMRTPLHHSVSKGYTDIVQLLLENKASIDAIG